MEIADEDFINGGEVDCKADWRTKSRISIRLQDDKFKVYQHFYQGPKLENVLKRGTLAECVELTNRIGGLEDTVDEVRYK